MPRAELLLAFAAATAAMAVFPGPAVLYTAAQTLARGRRAGLLAVLGTHLGCYAHVAAATLGLSALLAAVPSAYLALRIAGAAYLVWLGIGMIRSRLAVGAAALPETRSARRAFADSVVVQLLNPKVALFFLAFLPQFADRSASLPVWAQLLVLGVIVNICFSLADLAVVFAAASVSRRLSRSGTAERAFRWAGGAVMIGLGFKLAVDRG